MGNGPSYGWIATAAWYREGKASYGRAGFEKAAKRFSKPQCAITDVDKASLRGHHVVITGGNSGIGLGAAKALASMGVHLHLFCRSSEKGGKAKEEILGHEATDKSTTVTIHQCDVSVMQDVRRAARELTEMPEVSESGISVLVNNAGAMPPERTETVEGHESIMATMLGGTMLLTNLLTPALARGADRRGAYGARVVNVSSGGMYSVGSPVGDLESTKVKKYDGTLIYAFAKRAQVILTERMAPDFSKKGIYLSTMHPGWVDTNAVKSAMPKFYKRHADSLRSVDQGADTIVFLAAAGTAVQKSTPGEFWFDRAPVRKHMPCGRTTSSKSQDEQLMKEARQYCGL